MEHVVAVLASFVLDFVGFADAMVQSDSWSAWKFDLDWNISSIDWSKISAAMLL